MHRPTALRPLLPFLLAALSLGASPGLPYADEPAAADPYGGCYTAEELAALDRALWVVNATRQDLHFKKDYAKGYECFPIVREMMEDPLRIGPVVSNLAQACNTAAPDPAVAAVISASRLNWGEDHVMPYEEWASSSEWVFNLSEDKPRGYWTTEYLQTVAGTDFHGPPGPFDTDQPAFDSLRLKLPTIMAWHDVLAAPQGADEKRVAELDTWLQAQPQHWYMLKLQGSYYNSTGMACDYLHSLSGLAVWAQTLPTEFFPADAPLILETPAGCVCVGTMHDDAYTDLDCALIIEPGGNDIYLHCRLAGVNDSMIRSTAAFVDLGGDDFYDCADVDITLGAAVLGVAAFYDLGGGNDRYYGGNFSLGAAAGGIATFYDDGGSDYYSGKVYTQGAAGFGIAVMCDDSVRPAPDIPTDVETPDPIDFGAFDNDTYTAWSEAQGFARTRGVAICVNKRGNETYHAGGVYLHAPLFSDRYQSFSQGFAIGERDIDYAGGIALLADYGGNDRYLGDVYNQGVGYWYSAGFLYDGGGNDLYEMTQYGQGSGIHLAVGGLIDEAGSDTYIMHNGLGQSGSHDFAASLLMDKGGNDRYLGNTSCNGCGLTNSVGLFFDRSGDDVYAARKDSGINVGRAARGFGSLGVFVDLGGADSYLGRMDDAMLWQRTTYGAGLDYDPAKMAVLVPSVDGGAGAQPASGPGDGFDKPTADVKMPDEVRYAGALNQGIFDKLWEIAIRWEVGDNRAIVPEARKRLIAFGPEVLPYVEGKMDDPNSLAIRGYVDVFKAFAFKPPPPPEETGSVPVPGRSSGGAHGRAPSQTPAPTALPEPEPADTLPLVEALLTRQLQSGEDARKLAALSVITELKIKGVAPALTALLDDPDLGMQRRAIAALGAVGSSAANERLIALLNPSTDEALTKVSIETLCTLNADCYAKLRGLLGSPSFTVRDVLENQLSAQWATYGDAVKADYLLAFSGSETERQSFDTRAKRSLLRLMLRSIDKPTSKMVEALHSGLGDSDWGVAADTAELVRYWGGLCQDDPELDPLFSGNTGLSRELSGYAETTENPQPLRLPEK